MGTSFPLPLPPAPLPPSRVFELYVQSVSPVGIIRTVDTVTVLHDLHAFNLRVEFGLIYLVSGSQVYVEKTTLSSFS
jgi:hypothetical protein